MGGLHGEVALVDQALKRARVEASEASEASEAEPPKDPQSSAASESEPEQQRGPHGEWIAAAQRTGGVPAAMILRPARGTKITPVVRTSRADSTSARKSKSDQKAPPKAKVIAPPKKADKPKPAAKSEEQPKAPQSESTKPGPHEQPTKVQDSLLKQAAALAEAAPDNLNTGKGWARRSADSSTRKFDADVDDAWFDYFGDDDKAGRSEASEALSTSKLPAGKAAEVIAAKKREFKQVPVDGEAALNFSLSEPSDDPVSIPPETFDRLLDSGPEMVDLQERFITLDSRDRDKAFEAADAIAELGEKAIEALDLMFPGRVFLDRYQYTDDLPPVDQHGPLLHALVRLADVALPVAKNHLDDSSNESRFYAVYLLSKLDAEPVLGDLFDRLFDRDQQTRRVAAELVMQYQTTKPFKKLRGRIRDQIAAGDDVHVTVAARLLGRLRDVDAIDQLIAAMDDSATPRVKLAILEALTEITLHHLSTPYEWAQWRKKAKGQTREEWIVDALDAADSDLRERAYDEVQRMPGLQLNYHPDQPSKLRKRAQKELRTWFENLRG
jgi:hypothetical protein